MRMLSVAHPEVLSPEWLPPFLLDRATEATWLVGRLTDALRRGRPRGVAVVGAASSGAATLARWAARSALQEFRRTSTAPSPLLATVRGGSARGTQGIATELLQLLDSGFSGRGFHTTEILAGFLRRLRREGRAALVVLDDLGPGTGDLRPLLRAFAEPDCFLPEGESGLPPLVLVLAGSPEARGVWKATVQRGWDPADRIELPAYRRDTVERIARDRLERALGRPVPEEWFDRFLRSIRARPSSPSLALDLLRQELIAPPVGSERSLFVEGDLRMPGVEPPLLAALARAASRHRATVAELKRWEAEFAMRTGARPLPATTFWRRIVRLESAGLVHREVRAGGAGGTRSVVELLRPITAPPLREPRGTPPAGGWTPGAPSFSVEG